MFRLAISLVVNLLLLLAWPIRGLMRALGRRRSALAVVLRVRGELPYLAPPRRRPWLFRLLSRREGKHPEEPTSLRDLERDLAALAERPEVKAVVLHLESFSGSGAALTALLKALEPLRKAGKKVTGYSRVATTGEYRLLAQLDRFELGPGGRLELAGYAAEVLSLRDALALAGVRPQFVRRGEFKTAPEMFTEASISPAQRKTLEAILDERTDALLQGITSGRNLTLDAAKAALDQGPYSARRAIDAKLVDGTSEPAAIEDALKAEHGKKLQMVPYGAFQGAWRRGRPAFRPLRRPKYLAVVPVRGVINVGEGRGGSGPTVAGSDSVVEALDEAVESSRAPAILLYIDSRGGSAVASELIHAAVHRANKKKPVIAYCDTVAASGGYMAAVGAREFWSAPESIVGSIGVFAGKLDVEGLLKQVRVGVDEIRRGAHAGLYSLLRGWTDEERAVMERDVEETYQDFLRIVASGRNMTTDAVHAVAEGRVFTGTKALQAKLVDGNCDFQEAIRKACTAGGLPFDAPLGWIDPSPAAPSPLELLRPAMQERLWMLDLSWLR
ncbi:MAG: signal peptide peptidase SppA [Deltaproteobacteria bacterium]|nr:signal peptide peptidase SppA [Deltaproteobacteria bacterium]